ncbi:MAG: hypothetical protein ACM3JH_14810 [Acidithiobacillales bacterium]
MKSVFGTFGPGTTALVLAAVMMATWRIGFVIGRRDRARGAPKPEGKFDEAVIAILGLLLAFSFSMALAKYDHRREMVVEDSNTIGDFYTCASLLKEPVRSELVGVIREYTELRLDLARRAQSFADVERELQRIQNLQSRMTVLVGEALASGTPIASPLTNTLNDLTSAHAARLAALRDQLPRSVVLLLFVAAAITTWLVGGAQGISERPPLGGTLSFFLLVALVVYVILDLNDPTKGLITVSQEPMRLVLESMGK